MKRTWLWKACPFYIFSLHCAIKKEHLQSLLVSVCVCVMLEKIMGHQSALLLRLQTILSSAHTPAMCHTEPSAIPVQCKRPPRPAHTDFALYSLLFKHMNQHLIILDFQVKHTFCPESFEINYTKISSSCITRGRLLYWDTAASCSMTVVVSYSLSWRGKMLLTTHHGSLKCLRKP